MKALYVLTLLLIGTACNAQKDRVVGGACDGCELMFDGMPKSMSWETTISPKGEPGEPMIIEGTIYKKDGKTPAPDVVLYVYHTDAQGYYSNIPGQKELRHGHLRGWIKTGADGKYKFTSVRPAQYPRETIPAHIHPIVKEPGLTLYYIDEYLFEGDSFLTDEERKRQEKRGGNGIITLTKKDGVWRGTRDIILGMNIPNY